jgi:hypothetical protein
MSTIIPRSEIVHRAVRWISDERKASPGRSGLSLALEASFKFDLSPAEEEWMIATFGQPAESDLNQG